MSCNSSGALLFYLLSTPYASPLEIWKAKHTTCRQETWNEGRERVSELWADDDEDEVVVVVRRGWKLIHKLCTPYTLVFYLSHPSIQPAMHALHFKMFVRQKWLQATWFGFLPLFPSCLSSPMQFRRKDEAELRGEKNWWGNNESILQAYNIWTYIYSNAVNQTL